MRFIGLLGEPATGKTTIARNILKMFGKWDTIKEPYILAMRYDVEKLIVLGMYDDELFSGTDRLSMAVEPHMKEWLINNRDKYQDYAVFFEGDRLGTLNFIEWLKKEFPVHVFHINASEEVKHQRHLARGDSQTDKFLNGRKTKYKNILGASDGIFLMTNNNSQEDMDNCVNNILEAIQNPNAKFDHLPKSKKQGFF